jgi:hypothetical protein
MLASPLKDGALWVGAVHLLVAAFVSAKQAQHSATVSRQQNRDDGMMHF